MSEARRIADASELVQIAAAGAGYVIDPFNRRWHHASCARVRELTIGQPKWFAATEAARDAYLDRRMQDYATAKPIEPCPICAGGERPRAATSASANAESFECAIDQLERGFVARASHRVTFGPRRGSGAHSVQAELRRQLAQFEPGPGETLHAVFHGGIPENSDVENQLLYNVFDGGSARALARGVRFELDDANQVGAEYRYEIAPAGEEFTHWATMEPIARWSGLEILPGSSERLVARTWWAMRSGPVEIAASLDARERFGIRMALELPNTDHGRLTAERAKQLLDGIVCALQRHIVSTAAVTRIASQLEVDPTLVEAEFVDGASAALGNAERPMGLTSAGVQWNPDDSRLVAAEITLSTAPGPRWRMSGEVSAVSARN
jgi:hypothetical protein